jgi:hypothetical protein
MYGLVVPGRSPSAANALAAVLVAVFGVARLHLTVDHSIDILFSVALGSPVTVFRYFTPTKVFPVVYRLDPDRHINVTGRRSEAILQAVRDQLGLTVLGDTARSA